MIKHTDEAGNNNVLNNPNQMKVKSLFKHHVVMLSFLFQVVFIGSCSQPKTLITGSWYNQSGFEAVKIKSVFIAALTNNIEVKGAIEEAFAKEATLKSMTSLKSIDFFKDFAPDISGKPPSKEEILNKIRATGSDVILTVNLKDSKSETRYVPGSTTYQPIQSNNYYNNFYGYYQTAYTEVYTEGYYTSDKVYFLECNLYNTANEELIWSAQSQTTNPSKIEAFAKDYAKVIVEQMNSDRMTKSK